MLMMMQIPCNIWEFRNLCIPSFECMYLIMCSLSSCEIIQAKAALTNITLYALWDIHDQRSFFLFADPMLKGYTVVAK